MNLSRYHEQHAEIRAQLEDLRRRTEPGAFAKDREGARQSLVALGAKLNIHLAFEDVALYPPLLKSADDVVQAKTRFYREEMGGLKEALGSHLKRWLSLQRVDAAPEAFRTETSALLQALERRLMTEDQDFYPLLEARA